MSRVATWLLAIRPKTLSLSIAPVMVGTALAWSQTGRLAWGPLLATLVAALSIQIGTNLHNDAADFERGADGPDRLGPDRVTATGLLSASAVRWGSHLSFALALALGIYLVLIGGWPILALGLASLAAGYAYTGGPAPLAYRPVGELFVFLFFGLGAVAGTYWLQVGAGSMEAGSGAGLTVALLAGSALGLPAAAVLIVNNYRDRDGDRRVGKNTLAVWLGRPAIRWLYALAMLSPPLLSLPLLAGPSSLLPWLALPLAVVLVRQLWRAPIDAGLNRMLANTARWQLLFALLLSVAFVFG
jgi:1,4-dihydroxy-2-naphthoate octaprenyltransferase